MLLTTLLVVTIAVWYWLHKRHYSFWKNKGVSGPTPLPVVGNMLDSVLARKQMGDIYDAMYKKYKGQSYVGIFRMSTPALLVRDVELIKNILLQDFNSFHDNDFQVNETADPLMSRNPFVIPGEKWKRWRAMITPLYTSGKVKAMVPLMVEVSETMVKYLENEPAARSQNGIEAKEVAAKFTTDVVASCSFGLQGNSFTGESHFRAMGRRIMEPTFISTLQVQLIMMMPWLNSLLRIPFIPAEVDHWLRSIVDESLKMRKLPEHRREDLLQALLDLQQKHGKNVISDEDIRGNCLMFYLEGFETSSTLLSFALYEVAAHPSVQSHCQTEIEDVLQRHDGLITYDSLQEMTYMDKVLNEALRKWPPAVAMHRLCTERYKLPKDSHDGLPDVELEPGTTAIIPVLSLHRDPEHFPNPDRFDPERFSEENKRSRNKFCYLPFGEGPRICLGSRFGLTQVKCGLTAVLRQYHVTVSPKTQRPLQLEAKNFLAQAKGGLWLTFTKRNQC